MEAGSGAAAAVGSAALGLLGATSTSSLDILDRGLGLGRHLEDDDTLPELAHIHPRERPDWEETISAMARSAEFPEMRSEPLMRSSCGSSTASMKVKNVKKLCFTKGHFPKLAECAHFHYENVDFGTIQLSLGDEQSEVTRNSQESKELVYLVHISCQGRSWIVKRSYEDFRVLDKHLHLCIYDRRFSQLPELPRFDSLTDQAESVSQMLLGYLSRLSAIADNKINCGPALTWMEVDNKGNHLLVHEESSINVPAIAAAHVIKRYIAQASDELSFEVGDIVSVIDMPPKEDTTWWRGKHGFQVGYFPSECVELINDKVPQSMTNSVPKPASPCSGLPPASWSLFPPYLEMESVIQDNAWVADPLNHYSLSSVSKKHGKLITFLRSFMKSRPTKQKLKQRGILRERVFGCDLGEHLLNSGHDVPQVLKSCTEFIEKHGVVDGIYRLSGIASNIQKLRHEFDSEQIPDLTKDVYVQDIHCVGSLCKLYFRELPNPLLTYQLYEKFSEAVSAATDEERLIKIHDVIQQLPPPHYRTLEFLMRHLSRLAAFSYITNMHSKNLAIVWAPNLLRSKQIESACFSGTAAFMEVRIQSVVVEFILNHVDVLFSTKLSSLIREGAGHNSLSRPKSLLVSSPSTKLLSLEEAQARTQAQINSPVTEDSKYIEVGEGPAALQGKFHTVIEFPTERKRPPVKSKKSPVGSWRSFFNLGKSSSMSKRKLQRNPSEPNELKTMALAGGRGDTATLRSAKSEESLSSLHNVEGESKVYRPRRPRSSSDALSASFNGDLLDGRQHCNSYDNLGAAEDSDGDDGPICVPALISPPRSAGEDVDLSPPDIGMASLDFDPMSFQCSSSSSLPDAAYAFPPLDRHTGAEGSTLKRGPGSLWGKTNGSDLMPSSFLDNLTSSLLPSDLNPAAVEKAESQKLTTSCSYADKPTQAVSPIRSVKTATLEIFPMEMPERTPGEAVGPPEPFSPKDSPLCVKAEPSGNEAFQMELQSKLASVDREALKPEDSVQLVSRESHEQQDSKDFTSTHSLGTPANTCAAPPPPKDATLTLALVLAESAHHTQSQPRSGETPTPRVSNGRASSGPHFQTSSEEGSEKSSNVSVAAIGCIPSSSSPSKEQQVLELTSVTTRPPESATGSTTLRENPPEMDPIPSDTRNKKVIPQSTANLNSPTRMAESQSLVAHDSVCTTSISNSKVSISGSSAAISNSKDTRGSRQHLTEVKPKEDAKLTSVAKSSSSSLEQQPPAAPKAKKSVLSPTQNQRRQQQQSHMQIQSQPLSKANSTATPISSEHVDRPYEILNPTQACCLESAKKEPAGSTPPAPPVRTMESKLATAALSQGEASYHPSEALHHHPVSPRKSSAHPYRAKSEAFLMEPQGVVYYHQRPVSMGPHPVPHHYRPNSVPSHLPYASKSEPQIPYSARVDNKYSTLGPRSYHHSMKARGNPRSVYGAAGHSGYSLDRNHGYPTIRRVHSLHVPATIRTVPIQRTEVPPDDMFYYHRPAYQCKPYQQAPPQSSQQADYHVTQLQPYFENGRVQYRYSPSSGEGPYYDPDPYGTNRGRHVHSACPDSGSVVCRAGGKATGYHYLARNLLPPGKEHSFVSRDMPPGHGGIKEAPSYLSWDPEEWECLRVQSIRRESRARQKVKGPVLSQYDNVGSPALFDVAGHDTLHSRSKSDPGKALSGTTESKDGRYLPRHMVSDPNVLKCLESDKRDRSDGPAKQSGSKKCQSSHCVPATHQQESGQHEAKLKASAEKLSESGGRSKHWQPEHANKRSFGTRYECHDAERHHSKGKMTSGYPAPEDQPAHRKADRSQHVNKAEADGDYSYRKPVQSHYDNLDDYHPVPQAQGPVEKRSGCNSYPAAHNNNNRASSYSTALGQGAFLQSELAIQRPETQICTE
ncbi:rho GTPase-activating protein 32 isoform X2 [Syngnathus scovelli]|uniref:rho GTPase-activating protein 32 isoform X2 n=2 Tax=Syngnathus scovelli TaxID=161590 RepID=UPI00210FF67D|nr:rho GTPase-activating protein 32 isoform X2 [Syngnathus scovelli]